jgi:hypothetical protein
MDAGAISKLDILEMTKGTNQLGTTEKMLRINIQILRNSGEKRRRHLLFGKRVDEWNNPRKLF